MHILQQPAYVLHARPYRETSLLLECLTREYGRVGVVARGVRAERAKLRRAQLEPFQPLAMDLLLRGELAALVAVEPLDAAARLAGDAGLAGLYLNELVVRLTARQDAQPPLFDAYAQTLARLGAGEPLGWTLRRFERDLLAAIGYALPLRHVAGTDEPLLPQAYYRYDVELGPVPCRMDAAHAVRGADLLALAADQAPGAEGQVALRRLMREVIRFHLGGGELRAWRMLAGLRRRG